VEEKPIFKIDKKFNEMVGTKVETKPASMGLLEIELVEGRGWAGGWGGRRSAIPPPISVENSSHVVTHAMIHENTIN